MERATGLVSEIDDSSGVKQGLQFRRTVLVFMLGFQLYYLGILLHVVSISPKPIRFDMAILVYYSV